MSTIIAADIARLLVRTPSLWEPLRGASLCISGGTGFFGVWLLEAILAANRERSLGCRVAVLSRDPSRFASKAPHLAADPALSFVEGDVRDFRFPDGPVTHVIHAATEASASLNAADPQTMFDVCVEGTRRMLALTQEKRASRFLFTSSGAVYGRQPPELTNVPEDFRGGPDSLDVRSAYTDGKRAAELLCATAARSSAAGGAGLHVSIARCFAFVGPHLPLDVHFAIGNFIRDCVAGGPIRISGDGTPFRSYLYAADLAEWLYTILLRGESGRAYNVGSEEAVSIWDLADRVAHVAATVWPDRGRPEIVMAKQPQPGQPAERYVPDCRRARTELGLVPATSLEDAIRLTMLAARGS
ncbi:MAG: NAD-dependent epimerase/dehydratase family protein [Planctomycetota bacterium]